MKIAYKVLRYDRTSCITTGVLSLRYKKGATVRARESTMGIFCFERKKDADRFKQSAIVAGTIVAGTVVKVRPIGRGLRPAYISSGWPWSSQILRWYRELKKLGVNIRSRVSMLKKERNVVFCTTPNGTICYPAVEVLE